MQVEKYISGLLFEHDCVIIPGFGGLVCNVSSARVHAGKSQFHPPFKKISFNSNLKNNDGLLAHRISQEENISYAEAARFLTESSEKFSAELTSEKRLELKNIGTFYLGEENKILFEQDETVNYLPEAFGLATFYSPAIKRETIERKVEKAFKDKVIVPSRQKSNTIEGKRRTPARRYIAIAASFLLISSLVVISLKTDLLKGVSLAGMNPFGPDEKPLYQPNEDAFPDLEATKENVSSLLAANRNDTTRYLNILINGEIPIVVSLQDETEVKKETKVKTQKGGHFNIIGGAFSIPENAEKFKRKLEKLGYDAVIIERKLQLVSYGNYATREKALQALEKIKAIQDDVWLMTN